MDTKTARTTYEATTITTTDGMVYRVWRVLNSSRRFMDIECQRITKTGQVWKTDWNKMHMTTVAHHAITGGTK